MKLPEWSRFSTRQLAFYRHALKGANAATLTLEGWPGTGKSKALSTVAVAVPLLGFKVLQTARTNQSADVLFKYTVAFMEQHKELHHLLPGALRYYAHGIERQIADTIFRLETLKQAPSNLDTKYARAYSLLEKTKRWANDNPKVRLAREWQIRMEEAAAQKVLVRHDKLDNVINGILVEILRPATHVAATSSMAWDLYKKQ